MSLAHHHFLAALQHWEQQKEARSLPKDMQESGAEQGAEGTPPGVSKAGGEAVLAILLQSSNHLVRMLSTFGTRVNPSGTPA